MIELQNDIFQVLSISFIIYYFHNFFVCLFVVQIPVAAGGQKAWQRCPLGGHFEKRQCHALAAWHAHRAVQKWRHRLAHRRGGRGGG